MDKKEKECQNCKYMGFEKCSKCTVKDLSQQVTKLEAERDELKKENDKMKNMLFCISGIVEGKKDHDSQLVKTYIKQCTPK